MNIVAAGQSMTFRQVGWHGQTGAFYSLDEDPSRHEPGSFGPLWILAHNEPIIGGRVGKEIDEFLADPSIGEVRSRPGSPS